MATRKRKIQADIQPIYDDILDILVRIKPSLTDTQRSAWSPLVSDLHKVAALAESISQQSPRTNQEWLSMADTLDREGVNLWNTSSSIKGGVDAASLEVVAAWPVCAVRLAAFRLIEAGLEQKPCIQTLIHVLQLASKTGASLSETGRHDVAAAVLTCAAKYEEQLKVADDSEKTHQYAKAQAQVLYLSGRMESAWRDGNDGVADFMLQKITENDQRLRSLRQTDRDSLASKLLDIGKSVLRTVRGAESNLEKPQYQNAIKWLQRAFSVVDGSPEADQAGSRPLKRHILKSLARGYYLSASHETDNLDRAEASLNELITTMSDNDSSDAEHQQLRWMKMAILKKRNAAEPELTDAMKSIIDHMDCSDADITDVLQELRSLHEHTLVVVIHRLALRKVLETGQSSILSCVDRLLLSLLFRCSKDADHARAMQDIEAALTLISSADVELSKVSSTACLTLLWQFGDRHYSAMRWAEAADWYLCGTHGAFASMARSSHAKCFRKAALCYIQHKEYSSASAILRRCPGNEAASHYVALLCAIRQGLEDEAIVAVENMAKAPDFDRKMLLLATQLANESDMKALLLSVLETLLRTVQQQPNKDIHTEGLSLIRCVIRLVVKLMKEPGANSSVFVVTLLRHFTAAKMLISEFYEHKRTPLIAKDISWLWRTAYNCAVCGCTEWPEDEAVSSLFDVSEQLLELYCASALEEVDSELYAYQANATFAATAGRVFALRRRLGTSADGNRQTLLAATSEYIKSSQAKIESLSRTGCIDSDSRERMKSFAHAMRVFHIEVLCHMNDWKQVLHVIETLGQGSTDLSTLEAIADILWTEKECPVQVLFAALEAILHAALESSTLSVEKFSRWLRAVCTILLSRNSKDDRVRAIGYVEQGIHVMEEHSAVRDDSYPVDERQWLCSTAYNTGIECFHASLTQEAQRWFEAATVICRFTPDGKMRSEKISDTYSDLLARFTPQENPKSSSAKKDSL